MKEYSIRSARPGDLDALTRVEHAASQKFLETEYSAIASEAPTSVDEFRSWFERGALVVAVDAADEPVGFAIAYELDGQAHLHEIDVDPAHGRRGVGRRLIAHVCARAGRNGHSRLTLSTFADVPWNAPYYRRLGFRDLAESEVGPGLIEVRRREKEAGLDVARRVYMSLALGRPDERLQRSRRGRGEPGVHFPPRASAGPLSSRLAPPAALAVEGGNGALDPPRPAVPRRVQRTPRATFRARDGATSGGPMNLTREDGEAFATEWEEAWNARDVASVLKHFHENVVFTSPTALAVVGSPTLHGKEALEAYWMAALGRIGSLRFTVDGVLWDPEIRTLAILYTSDTDGSVKRVSENLTFDESGQVVRAEVFHGAARAG